MLFTTKHDEKRLKAGLKQATDYETSIEVEGVYNTEGIAGYITKAKTQGTTKHGRHTRDLSAYDRVGFASGISLKRSGTIGEFWAKPKQELLGILRERKAKYKCVKAHGEEAWNYMDAQFADAMACDLSGLFGGD